MGCGNFLPLAQLQSVYPSLLITQCAKNTASQWQQVLTTNWVNDAGGLPVTLWTHTGPALCLSVYHLISALCPCYPAAGLMESNIRAWLQGRSSANSFQGCGHICWFCFGFFWLIQLHARTRNMLCGMVLLNHIYHWIPQFSQLPDVNVTEHP